MFTEPRKGALFGGSGIFPSRVFTSSMAADIAVEVNAADDWRTWMLQDRYGLVVSTASDEAHAHYLTAVDQMLGAEAGAGESLGAAIEADQSFALAYAAMADTVSPRDTLPRHASTQRRPQGWRQRQRPESASMLNYSFAAVWSGG